MPPGNSPAGDVHRRSNRYLNCLGILLQTMPLPVDLVELSQPRSSCGSGFSAKECAYAMQINPTMSSVWKK